VQLRLENHIEARSPGRREASRRRGWLRRNDTARSIGSVAVIVRIYWMKLTISGINWANLWTTRHDIPLSAAHVTPSWWTCRCLGLEQPPRTPLTLAFFPLKNNPGHGLSRMKSIA
jgi:hypothetical protein